MTLPAGAVQHPLDPRGEGFLGLGSGSLVAGLPLLADPDRQVKPLPVLDGWPTSWALFHSPIMYQQIILDKTIAGVFNVGTFMEPNMILRNCHPINLSTLGPKNGHWEYQDIGASDIKRWGRLHRYCDYVVRTVVEVQGGDVFMVSTKYQDEAVAKAMRSASRKRKYQPINGAARSRSDFIQWEAE